MDQRLYHYQYRRPRLSNPTYSSFNVNNSMTYFMSNPANQGSVVDQRSSYEDAFRQSGPRNAGNYYNSSEVFNNRVRETPPQSYGSETPRERSLQFYISAQSHLSNYGNSSLAFNERQIYNKQNSKFNIISLKPKDVPDQIKQYPKLTLEDKDNYYYRKVQKMREQEMNSSMRNNSLPTHYENVAGKHTFVPQQGKAPNYYPNSRYFTPKMLNHADEVGNIL